MAESSDAEKHQEQPSDSTGNGDEVESKDNRELKLSSGKKSACVDPTRAHKMWMANHDQVMKLTKKQIAACRRTFSLFDKNGDGTITAAKLGSVLTFLGHNPSDAELAAMIVEIDVDGNGVIDFSEFLHMMAHNLSDTTSEKEVLDMYRIFDNEGTGFISPARLRQVMAGLGEVITNEDVQEMVKEADADGDGKISKNDFVTYATQVLNRRAKRPAK